MSYDEQAEQVKAKLEEIQRKVTYIYGINGDILFKLIKGDIVLEWPPEVEEQLWAQTLAEIVTLKQLVSELP